MYQYYYDGSFSQTGMGQSLKRLFVLGSPFNHDTTVLFVVDFNVIQLLGCPYTSNEHQIFMNSESVTGEQ